MTTDKSAIRVLTDDAVELVSRTTNDCVLVRVEPDIADSEFLSGHEFEIGLEVLDDDGAVVSTYSATVGTGDLGNGDPPFLEVRHPTAFQKVRLRSFCRRLTIAKAPILVGLRECTLDAEDAALPAPKRVPKKA